MAAKEISLNTKSVTTMFSMITKDTFLNFGLILKKDHFSEIINTKSDQHKSTKK